MLAEFKIEKANGKCDNKPMTGQQVEINPLIWHQLPGREDQEQKRVSYKI